MVGKAQKSHGARSWLYGGCSNGVLPIHFFQAEHRIQFRSCPMQFLGFSNHEKGAPRQEISKWSTVCNTFSRSGWSVVRSASLAKGDTSKKRPSPHLYKVPTRSNKVNPRTLQTALISTRLKAKNNCELWKYVIIFVGQPVSSECMWKLYIGSYHRVSRHAGLWTAVISLIGVSQWIYQLTPWSRVLLEKLIVTQLVKKFATLYGIWTSITVFTRACHWFLSWAKWIHSTTSHPT
jgi:hypothetical protein